MNIQVYPHRIILNKTGTKESIIQVISVLSIIPFIVACITSFGYKFYSLAAIFFFLSSILFMFFSIATSKRKIILGKEKNPKRQILFFPGKIKFVYFARGVLCLVGIRVQ